MRGFFMLFSKRLFSFKILDNVDPLCEVCNFAGDKKNHCNCGGFCVYMLFCFVYGNRTIEINLWDNV